MSKNKGLPRFRTIWRFVFRVIAFPLELMATIAIYLLFDVTWKQAWRGEL